MESMSFSGRPFVENTVDLITASNASGIHFTEILSLVKTGKVQSVLQNQKYYISKSTVEILRGKRRGIDSIKILENQ